MKLKILLFVLLFGFSNAPCSHGEAENETMKKKIIVVSSYHREYLWSQDTNKGFCDAMLKFGYFDNQKQIMEYTQKDYIITSKVVLKRLWMDTKRNKNKLEMKEASNRSFKIIKEFQPDLIFLGDDNAVNYIGNLFLDTDIPIVFWGVNNTPVKYSLLNSAEKPGHNVTGVYQSGYHVEGFKLLKAIVPAAKTFAILSDKTNTGRSHLKKVEFFARRKEIPLRLVETISTNNFETWKKKALELQERVDAFYIAQASGMKDNAGKYVPIQEVVHWYTTHIRIPEVAIATLVSQGMLCAAADKGYNQGHEAVVIANDILANGAAPASYPTRSPKRGPLIVNKGRAETLGIKITEDMGIEEFVE